MQPEAVFVAVTVKVYDPVTVGVPCNSPVVSNINPVGNVPEVFWNVKPERPVAVAVIVWSYAVPAVPSLKPEREIDGQPTMTVYPMLCWQPELVSVAITEKLYVPGVVGVPDSAAVVVLTVDKLTPGGSVPLVVKEKEPEVPPLAVTFCE